MSIGGVVIQFAADTRGARRDIDKLIRSLQNVGKESNSTGDVLKKFGKAGMLGLAAGAAGAALGIAKLASSAVSLAADFEQSMNVLQSATNATAADMEKLNKLAKDLGSSTVFSAQDAADAMIELGKAGLTTAEIMGGAAQASLALAATEGMNLADAATAITNAMSAFRLGPEQVGAVADALAGGSAASTASVSSLTQALAQVSAGAATAGLSLQETVGTLAAFDKSGIKGTDAGTSLKTMLTRLIPQTKRAQDAFAKYGLAVYRGDKAMRALRDMGLRAASSSIEDVTDSLMAFYKGMGQNSAQAAKSAEQWLWIEGFENTLVNANGSMKDATQIAEQLQQALGGLSESGKIEAGNILFGSDASRAATQLANLGATGLQPFIDATSKAGEAARLADARTKGFKGALEKLQGAVETAGIKLGEKLLPTLTKWIDDFSAYLESPEGQAWVDNLASGIEEFATKARDWVTDTLIPTVEKIGPAFTDALADIETFWADFKSAAEPALEVIQAIVDLMKWIRAEDEATVTRRNRRWFEGGTGDPFDFSPQPSAPARAPLASGYGAGTTVVNVTNNYPKPETASQGTAASLRTARNLTKGW